MNLQILISLTFLTVASIFDLRSREVPNKLWLIVLSISLISLLVSLYNDPDQFTLILTSITITTALSISIFYLGLYGGADAKALIMLSVAHPIASIPPIHTAILPLTTLTNSLLLMLVSTAIALIKNIQWKSKRRGSLFKGLEEEPIWRKAAALFLCVKVSKAMIKPYDMIAERLVNKDENGRRTLKLFQRIQDEETQIDESVPDDVFITYSLPMLPFILLAYIITLTLGDLIFHLLATII